MELTLFSDIADKFNAFDRQDKRYIKRWLLYSCVWMVTVKVILCVAWMTIVMILCKILHIGYKPEQEKYLKNFRLFMA
jgi:hypothetical protein